MEYTDLLEDSTFGFVMHEWKNFVQTPLFRWVSVSIFGVVLIGLGWSVWRKKQRYGASFGLLMVMSLLFLTAGNGWWGGLYTFLSEFVPLFGQVFRAVHTKWAVVAALGYAVGLGIFVQRVSEWLPKKVKWSVVILGVGFVGVLIATIRPAFEGKLLSPSLWVDIPSEYFELFDYLESQPESLRIAYAPVFSHWGWQYNDWGYRGSGFLWFGLKQPVLMRAFDVWSPYNEGFYREFSRAVYAQDREGVSRVLGKYQVSYVLIDESVFDPGHERAVLGTESLMSMLESLDYELEWQRGHLHLYSVNSNDQVPSFVYSPARFQTVEADLAYVNQDVVGLSYPDWISGTKKTVQSIFPFAHLTRDTIAGVSYEGVDDSLVEAHFDYQGIGQAEWLYLPGLVDEEIYSVRPVVTLEGERITIILEPITSVRLASEGVDWGHLPPVEIPLNTRVEEVWVGSEGVGVLAQQGKRILGPDIDYRVGQPILWRVYNSGGVDIPVREAFLSQPIQECWKREDTFSSMQAELKGDEWHIIAQDASGCLSLPLGVLDQPLFEIGVPYVTGEYGKPHFCLTTDEALGTCLHDEIYYHEPNDSLGGVVNRVVVTESRGHYWLDLIARSPDEIGLRAEIAYSMPLVRAYEIDSVVSLPSTIWDGLKDPKRLRYNGEKISVSAKTQELLIPLADWGRQSIKNCDVFNRGEVSKSVEGKAVVYEADGWGVACDYVLLDVLQQNQDYLVRTVGINEVGRGLRLFIRNRSTLRNVIEEPLPRGEYDLTYGLIGQKTDRRSGYDLTTETRSYGKNRSINAVSGLSVYRFPLQWASRIQLMQEDGGIGGFGGLLEGGVQNGGSNDIVNSWNNVSVNSVNKYGTGHYVVEVEGEGLIALGQGYDEGWIAYAINRNDQSSMFQRIAPWWFGERLEKVKVNGWGNGFLMPGTTPSGTPLLRGREVVVVIVYWPQYLQWAGLLGMGMVVIWLGGGGIRGRFFGPKTS
jgi:hypothetical protein